MGNAHARGGCVCVEEEHGRGEELWVNGWMGVRTANERESAIGQLHNNTPESALLRRNVEQTQSHLRGTERGV